MYHLFLLSLLAVPKCKAWSWTTIKTDSHNIKGPSVSGHSAITDQDHQRVLLFGGLTGSAGSPATDQLWSLDDHPASSSWNLHSDADDDDINNKNRPGPRMYSASAILDGSMYIMGGWDPGAPKSGGTFLDEVWRLDLETLKWTLSPDKLPCGPVSRHAACTVGDMIIMHTFRGVLVKSADNDSWVEQPTTGEGPDGLSMAAMVSLTDKSLLIYGGSTKTQQLSADAFVLDTEKWEWTKLLTEDDNYPQARASPCAAQCGENQCIVFGGACLGGGGYEGGAGLQAQDDTWLLTVVDESKATWELIKDVGDATDGPKARLAATLNPLPSDDGGFLLAGGWDPQGGTFDDAWTLRP